MAVYLVTGTAGFIGANYVRHVLDVEPDADVVRVDRVFVRDRGNGGDTAANHHAA